MTLAKVWEFANGLVAYQTINNEAILAKNHWRKDVKAYLHVFIAPMSHGRWYASYSLEHISKEAKINDKRKVLNWCDDISLKEFIEEAKALKAKAIDA